MARYIGPTCRISRRFEMDLDFKTRDLKTKCNLQTRPGQHGQAKKRSTGYGLQLSAKQQLRFKYGLLEKPFKLLYERAEREKGHTSNRLLQLLECRLDNIVYRMGFAATRREARQLVSHKAILVNGKAVNIPSFQVVAGDVVSVREKAQKQTRIQEALQNTANHEVADWIELDAKAFSGSLKRAPEREDLPYDINEQLVVELYSK